MNKIILSLLFTALTGSAIAQDGKHGAPPVPPGQPAPPAGQTVPPGQPAQPGQPGPRTYQSLELGADIPNSGFRLNSVNGEQASFEELKTEKGLLVMFSCNTCPYVIKAQPRTREAIALAKSLNIGMVILNSNEAQRRGDDGPMKMKEYADKEHYTVPYVTDVQAMMADLFGATRTPEVFLFNGEGKLVYKGAMEDNPGDPGKSKQAYLVSAMRAMVAGKPIKPAETKSIGCSIKRMAM